MLEDGGVIRPLLCRVCWRFHRYWVWQLPPPWARFAEILDDRNASYALAAQLKGSQMNLEMVLGFLVVVLTATGMIYHLIKK